MVLLRTRARVWPTAVKIEHLHWVANGIASIFVVSTRAKKGFIPFSESLKKPVTYESEVKAFTGALQVKCFKHVSSFKNVVN